MAAVQTDPKLALGYIALAQFHHSDPIIFLVPGRGLVIASRSTARDSANLLLHRAFQINPFIEVLGPRDLPVAWTGTLDLALYHYHKGDFARALDEFGLVIARTQKPGHPEKVPPVALWYHILTAVQLRRYDDAIKDARLLLDAAQALAAKDHGAGVRRVGDIRGRVGDIKYVLADLNRAAGHASEAEDLYHQVVLNDLGFYMAHARLADLYEEQGRWGEAVLERRRAIDANPEDPSLMYDLGATLADAHRDLEAEPVLQDASEANPREIRAAYFLGLVEARLGKLEDARTALKRFIALAPSRYSSMRKDAEEYLASLQ